MADSTPRDVVRAVANLVAWNWAHEERDYNTEALHQGNSREGHIFRDLMLIQRWLETFGYAHVEPRIVPDDRCEACQAGEHPQCGMVAGCRCCDAGDGT